MLCVDQKAAPEYFAAHLGANKAGVSVVTVEESDNKEAIAQALADSGAKGFVFSPATACENKTRQELVQAILPELEHYYAGDEHKFRQFPKLKHVVQVGHNAIRGVNYFKDLMVYAVPSQQSV